MLAAWKRKWFCLRSGQLCFFDKQKDAAAPGAAPKGCLQLVGATVSLLEEGDAGRLFCFRVDNHEDNKSVTMQAKNQKELLEWSSALAHATAVCNGGGIFLHHELRHVREQVVKWQHAAAAHAEVAARAAAALNAGGDTGGEATGGKAAAKELSDAMTDFFVAVAHADANSVAQLTSSARIAGRAAILEDGLKNLLTREQHAGSAWERRALPTDASTAKSQTTRCNTSCRSSARLLTRGLPAPKNCPRSRQSWCTKKFGER